MGNLKLTWDTISTCRATLFILNNGTNNPFNDAVQVESKDIIMHFVVIVFI